jgi:hypothetical protein
MVYYLYPDRIQLHRALTSKEKLIMLDIACIKRGLSLNNSPEQFAVLL